MPTSEAVSPAAFPSAARGGSYGQILKSSSIVGGAQAINLLIGMVRTKFVAVLLGPSGVGLVGLYQSATNLVGTISSLGIGQSGVREVAEAHGSNNEDKIGRTVQVLRRVCWLTGLLGWLLAGALAWPLSLWAFKSGDRAWAIAMLGLTLLLGSISGGQTALIQGLRRIGDLARLNVLSVIAGTLVSLSLYAWLGEKGIVPVLVLLAAANLGFSWWFARRIRISKVAVTWRETGREASRLISLGTAFMWSGLLTAGVAMAAQSLIFRTLGSDANGIYQAAWSLSGIFAGFILTAMGADFYPRLTAAAADNDQVNRLVNEQTEIGLLLALPGLLGTLVLAPWIIRIFYTAKFAPAADLLPLFVLGVFGRAISWPLGFIQLAKGASRWFAATETAANALHIVLIWLGLRWFGLAGVALAFAILYACYTLAMLWVASRLSHFRWSHAAKRLLTLAALLVAATFALRKLAPELPAAVCGALVSLGTAFYCIREIAVRLGPEHRISRTLLRFPLIGQKLCAWKQ
jgi:PST family polysaccharide transporter